MLATGGSSAGDTVVAEGGDGVGEAWQEWDASALSDLGVPVIQAVCATASRAAWLESDSGLAPLDAATQVAIPEFDGRLLGGVISFKERDAENSRVGVPVPHYAPDVERCGRVARLAVRTARLRTLPADAAARRRAAHELPDQARQGRHGGRARHAGQRAAPLRRVRGRRHAGRPAVRRRRRADARADRDRRPRRRVPDRRPAGGLAAAAADRRLPGVVRRRCPSRCARRWRAAGGRRRAIASSTATTS